MHHYTAVMYDCMQMRLHLHKRYFKILQLWCSRNRLTRIISKVTLLQVFTCNKNLYLRQVNSLGYPVLQISKVITE
jgi:hypothetical protein